jgi:3-deoxy-D-manno-octulosonic-acid transferase
VASVVLFSNKYRRECCYKLLERVAIYRSLNKGIKTKTIWIHCASVGEVRAVEPILEGLKDSYHIVLTSITKSGREYARTLQKVDFVALLPLDIYPVMCKAFNSINPDMLVLVETEFWPSMLYTASLKKVKIITINGRISNKSFAIYQKLKFFWKEFVTLIDVTIARTQEDADRFKFLNNNKGKIIVSGNIKYDRDCILKSKREDFLFSREDFVFTAGSTRKGEEEIIADVYNKICFFFKKIKFFLVPRHLSRIGDIIKILENRNIKYSFFSSGDFNSNFILVDLFGKLQSIYSISDVCYVGGSLVDKGGQNPIEPAVCEKPVLFGKNMHNFKSEAEILIKEGGALIIENSDDLANKIKMFISNKHLLKRIGSNALKAVNSQKGAVSFTIKTIKENLNA